MAFNNNQKKEANNTANTFGGTSFFNNNSSFDKSMMKIDFWASTAILKLYPELPVAKRKPNGPVYDKETEFKAFLSKNKSRALANAFSRYIEPKLRDSNAEGEEEVGIITGSNYIGLGTGKKYNCNPYLIFRTLNEEGLTIESIGHEFVTSKCITSLDDKTGKIEEGELESSIYEFVDTLREIDRAFSYADAHANREANAYDKASEKKTINAILTAMGVSTPRSGSSSFSTGRKIGGTTTSVAVDELDDIANELEN